MNDLVSIIMPVRNGLPYLEDCLESILNQSYEQWELIAVNDHSKDHTAQLLDRYTRKDKRIRQLNNYGVGIIDALKTGYESANGQYITRMDADDIMPVKKLEVLRALLHHDPDLTVATGHVKYFCETGVKDGYKSYETWLNQLCLDQNHYQYIYKECVIASPAWMMRRDHFEAIGGFESDTYPEDYDLCFRMYEQKVNIVSTNQIIHHWRDHGNRTSRNDENYADNRFLAIKLDYFHKIEVPKYETIVLIGAGKKGKTIAKYFIQNNIPFSWITNNQKKIGINIYGVILESYDHANLDTVNSALLISVANKDEQTEISHRIASIDMERVYYFC